jgi:hypothetical protein
VNIAEVRAFLCNVTSSMRTPMIFFWALHKCTRLYATELARHNSY